MNTDYGFLASWDLDWINDHKKWRHVYGVHFDGWSNRIKREKIDLVKKTEQKNGYTWFYAYMPAAKGGNKKVSYRLKIDRIEYKSEAREFVHLSNQPELTHAEGEKYQARLTFRILEIEDIEPIEVNRFKVPNNEFVKGGSQLLNVLVVSPPIIHEVNG